MANTDSLSDTFCWTLDKKLFDDTIFSKKKMVEFVDVKKVNGFIKNELGMSYQGQMNKWYDMMSVLYPTELEQIKKYKSTYDKKKKGFQVAIHLPKHKWGRTIPAFYLSLSILPRITRHSLCKDHYVDIDMQNAQPTIISEVARLNNINTPYLNKYVNQTKKYREFVMSHHNCSKDCAKNLAIVLMFGGSYNGWLKEWNIQQNADNKISDYKEIETELKMVLEIIYSSNPQIKKDVLKQDPKKWKSEEDAKRGIMSLWSQSVEKLIQETAILHLVNEKNFKLEHIVPCQDGFMILKERWYNGILEDIQKEVLNKTKINIIFLQKPFDEAVEIPTYEDDRTVDEWEDLLSVKKLADRFIQDYGDYVIKYKSNVYVFYEGRWYDETDSKKQHKLTLYISEQLYDKLNEDIMEDISLQDKDRCKILKLLRNNTSSGGKMSDIIKHTLSMAKESETDFNANPFLLGFNNGVYDLVADEFREYRFDDYITITTKYDYEKPDYGNEETNRIKEELAGIFEMIQPDEESRILYLQALASGLDGRAYQKLFLYNGQGGNGKGLTGALMDITLGDYYHQAGNGILKDVEKSNTPSPDMINLKNKRYINFKEVQGEIKCSMLRNLTGGGKFIGRYLNQNPESFFMSGTFVMEFNIAPELDGKPQRADYRRLVDILFPVNFTDDPTKIDREIGGVKFKKANPYYETQDFLQKSKLVFLDMLLGVYNTYKDKDGVSGMVFTIPESIRLRTEQFLENQNLFQKVMNDMWTKVDIKLLEDGSIDKKDEKSKTVQVKEIWESLIVSEEYRKLNYKEKRQYGRDEFYKWIEGIYTITGNSKTGKIIVGLERKTDYDEGIEKTEEDDYVDEDALTENM
jgi:phage/plasmid-associated DNA primase